MKKTELNNPEEVKENINYYIMNLKLGIDTLRLEYNREKSIFLFCENAIKYLSLIESLLNDTDLLLPVTLAKGVNDLYKKDSSLSIVTLRIVNTKREYNSSSNAILIIKI